MSKNKGFPYFMSILRYVLKFKRFPNLKNPKDLNEKVIWLTFNTNRLHWAEYADKLKVRDYVKEKGFSDSLATIYGIWENASDINFSMLPSSFVIKTNHGAGDVIVVKDKLKADLEAIRKKMNGYLKKPFGLFTGEPHYLDIKPYIFAEELITNDSTISTSLIDYKFYCFKGNPKLVLVCSDRIGLHANKVLYDMEWERRNDYTKKEIGIDAKDIPKPKSFDLMIQACRKLGADFPFVRIDFYESGGKMFFGEMTFTPAAGRSTALTQKGLDMLGACLNI